jgi:4-azaleucine resistance transporter AzlC
VTPPAPPAPPVQFSRAGFRAGVRAAAPTLLGMLPFGLVAGIAADAQGLSLSEAVLMSALVFAGSAQLVALGAWAHPAPVLGAAAAAFAVNLRYALMGPVLAPWLDRLRGWRLWGSLFLLVDGGWALSVGSMRAGGADAAFLLGTGVVNWVVWVATTVLGHLAGGALHPPPGHPIFFAAVAVFVALLMGMWRGRRDALPWLVAAAVALATSALVRGSSYIVVGALAGSIAGALRDRLAGREPPA